MQSTAQTNRLSGMREKLRMVERASSGRCWLRICIMDGQNSPTVASTAQKASS